MNNNKIKNDKLFVALPILQTYNATSAWIFAHIAFHIARSGFYDTKQLTVGGAIRYIGCSKNTYYAAMQKFISDGVLIFDDGKLFFGNNSYFAQVFNSYLNAFAHGNYQTNVSLIEVNPRDCDSENMSGKKAEQERSTNTLNAYLRDRAISNGVNDELSGDTSIAKSYQYLASLFGLDWRTIKNAIGRIHQVKRTFIVVRDKLTKALTFVMTSNNSKMAKKKRKRFEAVRDKRFDPIGFKSLSSPPMPGTS